MSIPHARIDLPPMRIDAVAFEDSDWTDEDALNAVYESLRADATRTAPDLFARIMAEYGVKVPYGVIRRALESLADERLACHTHRVHVPRVNGQARWQDHYVRASR